MDGCIYLFLAVPIPPDSGLQELQLISDHGWSMLGPDCVQKGEDVPLFGGVVL